VGEKTIGNKKQNCYQYLCTGNEISSHFTLKGMFGFSSIRNDAQSDDGLNKRPK